MDNGTITTGDCLPGVNKRAADLELSKPVLLIDSNQDWQNLVTSWLENAGYSVLRAHDASDALQKAGPYLGLIVLDLNLGGESGLILCTYLKRNYPEVPILLCTGMDHDDETIRAMLHMGADHYSHKGTQEEFLVAIRHAFARYGNTNGVEKFIYADSLAAS